MNQLRKIISEIIAQELKPMTSLHKMPLEVLLDILEDLDVKLSQGIIDLSTYNKEHNEILKASGYTEGEFEQMMDDRWDYIEDLRAVPPPSRSMN